MRRYVLRTLAYADIFNYPLTLKEINHWLIAKKPMIISASHLKRLNKPSSHIKTKQGFYFLRGREPISVSRRRRAYFSRHKIKIAQTVGQWLKIFPTIKLVAITGALAMNNADKNDDIDLLIITAANRLWLTRIFVTALTELLGIRRRPTKNTSHSNKICLNLWLDKTSLKLPPSRQNLYTAHEVAQIKPLWDRENTYKQFLSQNSWINNYLPNIKIPHKSNLQPPNSKLQASWLEKLTFQAQLWYMKPKITREKITFHSAFFHPNNTQKYVIKQYHQRLKKLKLSV